MMTPRLYSMQVEEAEWLLHVRAKQVARNPQDLMTLGAHANSDLNLRGSNRFLRQKIHSKIMVAILHRILHQMPEVGMLRKTEG